MSVGVSPWGTLPSGESVTRVELATEGLRVGVLTWGATIQSLMVPAADGCADLVLGFDTLAPYLGEHPFVGATVGRYANRIAGGRFEIDGVDRRVPANDGAHALHGGPEHFGRRNWRLLEYDDTSVSLGLVSSDGDMGFPGSLEVTTVLTVDGTTLSQEMTATSDAPTVVNLTNHAYFNLHGDPARTVDDHVLTLPVDRYLPVDGTGIPLPGAPAPVAATRYDFRAARPIGLASYDHTWLLDGPVEVSASGRRLRVTTTEPGVQIYTGDSLDGSLVGRRGVPLRPRSGLCVETQHFPDSPNRPDYPSTLLRPGETYRTHTWWDVEPASGS